MKWITKKGKEVKISDMDDNHATNIINMLIKNHTSQVILECILRGEYQWGKTDNKINVEKFEELNGDMGQQFNDTMYGDDQDYY